MAKKHVRVWVCALAAVVSTAAGVAGAPAEGRTAPSAGAGAQIPPRPTITGHTDGRQASMTAAYKGLVVNKVGNRADRSITIDIRYGPDAVSVSVDRDGTSSVSRGGRVVRVDSAEALGRLQQLLGASEAVFAVRALLAERESQSDLKAPEFTLLATAAFVASLVGDTDAPARLSARFVEKHRGIVRPVRFGNCWGDYTTESTAAWSDLENCMNEANQDASFLNGAYRRLACNAVWILRSESAWFEYLTCLSPLTIAG